MDTGLLVVRLVFGILMSAQEPVAWRGPLS